jgi:hypothetical protein
MRCNAYTRPARKLLLYFLVRREPPDDNGLEKLLRTIIGEEVQMKAAKGEHGSLKLLVRDLRRKT